MEFIKQHKIAILIVLACVIALVFFARCTDCRSGFKAQVKTNGVPESPANVQTDDSEL